MKDYQRRVIEKSKASETKRWIVDNLSRLEDFFDTKVFNSLDSGEQHRLRAQAKTMIILVDKFNSYIDILETRIERFVP